MKHLSKTIISIASLGMLFSIASCGSSGTPMSEFERKTRDIYESGLREGSIQDQTYEQWLESIRGEDGKDGNNGQDGHTPVIVIGANGNWYIDNVDTGISAQGEKGEQGNPGKDGISVVSINKTSSEGDVDTYTISYSDGTSSTFTVTNGVDGESIKGDPGKDGHTPEIKVVEGYWTVDGVSTGILAQGPQGEPGINGNSILTGNGEPQEELGVNGDSYIDLSSWNYYLKVNDSWVLKGNIKGEDGSSGENGLSAYELYLEHHPECTKDEQEWLDDLINGRLGNKEMHTVTFDSNGGTPVASQTVLHGEKAVRPETPTKTGYVLSDWVDENNDHWVFNGFSITSDITLTAVWSETYAYSKIKINEICSKNRKSFVDKYGEDSDWIELYNSSSSPVNLNGCGLSNNEKDPYLLTFGDIVIEPDSYMVVAVSGRENSVYNGEYHAPFTLSQKKEGKIVFSAPYGIVDSVTYPALKDDISFGRLSDELTMLKPSAGRHNEEVYVEKQILPAPTFSKVSGIYKDEFDLTLTSEEGYHIYYTLDSGTPNESSNLFDGPIHIYDKSSEPNILSSRTDICGSNIPYTPTSPVNKCMVVRAICYDDFGNYSPIVSSSYWIGQDDFIQSGVSVTSINTDFDNLFDNEKGIYCRGKIWDDWAASEEYDPSIGYWNQPGNYHQGGFDWEREGNITFLNHKHNLKCEQSIGMRIKGGTTRGVEKKSFNLFSRFLYDGSSKFDYKFNDKKCEKTTLRAGGNNYNYMVTDPINSMISKHYNLDFETQDTTPTYLYLNGEFWGVYFITDAFDSRFIEEKYDIEDSIIWKAGEIEEGYQTDISLFTEARATIGAKLLTDDGYNSFCEKYNVSSFVDNFIYHSYIDHFDYSMFSSNSSMWRSRSVDPSIDKSDGQIRFMLYDTDFSLGTHYGYDHYPKLFETFKTSSTLKYIFECPQLLSQIIERFQQFVELLSSTECIDMVTNYYNSVESLIRQSNMRFYGKEEAGQTKLYNTMIEYLQNRGEYYLSFVNGLSDLLN